MSMQDPIADLLTRVRNAQMASKEYVLVPFSKLKGEILRVLKEEGYIGAFEAVGEGATAQFKVSLRYFEGQPVIQKLKRMSKPSLRIYKKCGDIPKVMGGLGVVVVSTSMGVMADRQAREKGVGGELLFSVA